MKLKTMINMTGHAFAAVCVGWLVVWHVTGMWTALALGLVGGVFAVRSWYIARELD